MERKNGNWIIKGTEKKFDNGYFQVFEDDVTRPDGRDDKYSTIKFQPGAAVLPIDDEGNIYLTCQFRYALGRRNLEAIAGTVSDEQPLDAAKREAKEELGIEAAEWKPLGKIEWNTSITNGVTHLFIARGLSLGKPHAEPTEDIELVKISLDDAVQKALAGEITHAETCELVLRAQLMK